MVTGLTKYPKTTLEILLTFMKASRQKRAERPSKKIGTPVRKYEQECGVLSLAKPSRRQHWMQCRDRNSQR